MLKLARQKRKARIRAKIKGTAQRPRLSVFRSNKAIYAQVIDDVKGHTLASAFGQDAQKVGEEIAQIVKSQKIKTLVFDRSGYKYHGRIKALAEAVRAQEIKI
jgi:large subunit ribosomal protein L18